MSERSSETSRVLVTVYALFALAATSRAAVQILTRWHEAPVAFVLSGFSGVIYCLAAVALARRGDRWRRLAWAAVSIELLGVLIIGTVSMVAPQDFPKDTVWSMYGRGYLFVPLVLPLFGLRWLRGARTSAGP